MAARSEALIFETYRVCAGFEEVSIAGSPSNRFSKLIQLCGKWYFVVVELNSFFNSNLIFKELQLIPLWISTYPFHNWIEAD